MSGLNVNTPDFVPGGAAAPVNPFLKLAAKEKSFTEFVPLGGAPEFVPGVGFGGGYATSRPPVPVPASNMQQRGNGKREGDDMSLSEESDDDESQASNGAATMSPEKMSKGDESAQQPRSTLAPLTFADRLKAKSATAAAAPQQQRPAPPVPALPQQQQQPKASAPSTAQPPAAAALPAPAPAPAPAPHSHLPATVPAVALVPTPAPIPAPTPAPAPAFVPTPAFSSAPAPQAAEVAASPSAAPAPSNSFSERSGGGAHGRKGDRAYSGGGGGGGGGYKSGAGNSTFPPESMCAAFAEPVLVPEDSELLVKFGTKADGVQKYSIAELLAVRGFVKNVVSLPELLDKRTDPAKLKKDKPAEKKEKKQREKHTHREDRWVPAIVTDADHKLKKDVTDILNKLTPSNFEKLCERFLALEINTVDRMVMCVQQLHEIAMKFATYSNVYADLCEKLQGLQLQQQPAADTAAGAVPSVAKTFKKTLLNTCQAEFDEFFKEPSAEAAEALAKLSADDQMIEDNKRRTRHLGNITFIAELYKRNMLKANIMLECIDLLEGRNADEEEEAAGAAAPSPKREAATEEGLLCLCRLIITAGQRLEAESEDVRARIDLCFAHLDAFILDKATYSSKVRFALMDLRDLRKAGWIARKVQQKQEATTSEQQGKELPPTPEKKPESKEFGKGYKAQAAAKAAGGAPLSSAVSGPAGSRPAPPPKDFKGPRDDRKKKDKPVEGKRRDGGADEWETVGNTKSKGKPALKVATKSAGWGKSAAAPVSAPAAFQRKNTFDFGDEDGSEEEEEDDEAGQEVDVGGSKSADSSAGANFVGSEVASPADATAELFEARHKKKARGLLDELFSCHLLQEAVELLQEMELPLEMSRAFALLCVSHCVASGKPDAVDLTHQFLAAAVEKRLLEQAAVVEGALDVVQELDDICVDTPNAARLYGVMAARLGAVGLSADVVKQRVQELEQLRPKFKEAFADGLSKAMVAA